MARTSHTCRLSLILSLAAIAFAGSVSSRAADDDTREEFRHARVSNLHNDGKGLLAYGLIGPRRATFRDLAELIDTNRS